MARDTWPSEGETWTRIASSRREVMCLGEASGADGDALGECEPVGGMPIEAVGRRSAFFVDGETAKVVEERAVRIGGGGEEAVVEGGLGGEELEELGVGDAELSVLLTEGVGLGYEVEEASATEVVVAVEFMVLKDEAGLVEALLRGGGVVGVEVVDDGGGAACGRAEGEGG